MVGNYHDKKRTEIKLDSVKNTYMKVLIGKEEGWENHVMRVMEVESFGYTPYHSHPWPHINFMIEGEGELEIDGVVHQVQQGSYAYVEANKIHQFRNIGDKPFKFICIVPINGHNY